MAWQYPSARIVIDKPIPNTRFDESLMPLRETTDDPRRKAELQSLILAFLQQFVLWNCNLANSCALRCMKPVGMASKAEEAHLPSDYESRYR